MAILIARQCSGTMRGASSDGESGASLEATGCRHQSSACALLAAMVDDFIRNHKTLTKHNF